MRRFETIGPSFSNGCGSLCPISDDGKRHTLRARIDGPLGVATSRLSSPYLDSTSRLRVYPSPIDGRGRALQKPLSATCGLVGADPKGSSLRVNRN